MTCPIEPAGEEVFYRGLHRAAVTAAAKTRLTVLLYQVLRDTPFEALDHFVQERVAGRICKLPDFADPERQAQAEHLAQRILEA